MGGHLIPLSIYCEVAQQHQERWEKRCRSWNQPLYGHLLTLWGCTIIFSKSSFQMRVKCFYPAALWWGVRNSLRIAVYPFPLLLNFHYSSEAECQCLLTYYNKYILIQARKLQLILLMKDEIKQLLNQRYCTRSSENTTRKKKTTIKRQMTPWYCFQDFKIHLGIRTIKRKIEPKEVFKQIIL